MMKVNGYTQKPHPFQIIGYVFFSCLLLTYFLITFPLSAPACRAVGGTLIVVFMACVVISCHICTRTDTTDPLVKEAWRLKGEGKDYSHLQTETKCEFDRVYIHKSSKHCKRCKRCTVGFDHHCKWINNDIGKANYKMFVTMIVSVFLFLSTYLVFGALVTVRYAVESDMVDYDVWIFRHNTSDILAGIIVLWIFMLLALLFTLLDLNLVLFHIFLIRKGLTTFQYITYVQQRKENRAEMEYVMKMLGEKKTRLDFILCLNRKKKVAASSTVTTPTPKVDGLILKQDESPITMLKKIGTGQGLLSHLDDLDHNPEVVSEKNTATDFYPKDKLAINNEIVSQRNASSAELKGPTPKDSIDGGFQSKMLLKDADGRRSKNLSIDVPQLANDQNDNNRFSSPLIPPEEKDQNNRDIKARKNTEENNSSKNRQKGQLSKHNNYDKIVFDKDEKPLKVKDADASDSEDGIDLKSPPSNSAGITKYDNVDIEHGYSSKYNDFRDNQDDDAEKESQDKVIEV